jgi:predicted MFS family arabinose efflux permease
MADRHGRGVTLKLAAITATLTMALLPYAAHDPLLLDPVIFLAGGAISGIYALGVILIGQDFRGQTLAVVSTGFGMAYSAGSIVGATPVGLAIDAFGMEALPIAIAIGFCGADRVPVRAPHRQAASVRPARRLPPAGRSDGARASAQGNRWRDARAGRCISRRERG